MTKHNSVESLPEKVNCPDCGKEVKRKGLPLHQRLYCKGPASTLRVEAATSPDRGKEALAVNLPDEKGTAEKVLPLGLTPETLARFAPIAKEVLGINALERATSVMMDRIDKQTEVIDKLIKLAAPYTNPAKGPSEDSKGGIGTGSRVGQHADRILGEAQLGDIAELIKIWKAPATGEQIANYVGMFLKGMTFGSKFKAEGVSEQNIEDVLTAIVPKETKKP